MYYKGSDGIILVYDVTDPKSYEDVENYWINEVENYAAQSTEILLISNKNDLNQEL